MRYTTLAVALPASVLLTACGKPPVVAAREEVKVQGTVDKAAIKAATQADKEMTQEAQSVIDADAKADVSKRKAHQKAQAALNHAAADVAKKETDAVMRASKAN